MLSTFSHQFKLLTSMNCEERGYYNSLSMWLTHVSGSRPFDVKTGTPGVKTQSHLLISSITFSVCVKLICLYFNFTVSKR